jgi:hypothetical protein
MNLNFNLKRNIRENLIILLVSLFLFFLVFIKYKYIFLKYEYYTNGLIYSAKDSTLLTGIIIDFEDELYSEINYIKNGYLYGEYELIIDDSPEKYIFLDNIDDLNISKKILNENKLSITIDVETNQYLDIVIVKQNEEFYKKNIDYQFYSKKVKLINNYFLKKYKLKIITFYFYNNIINPSKVEYLKFIFENNNLSYYVYDHEKYRIVGDSVVYVP